MDGGSCAHAGRKSFSKSKSGSGDVVMRSNHRAVHAPGNISSVSMDCLGVDCKHWLAESSPRFRKAQWENSNSEMKLPALPLFNSARNPFKRSSRKSGPCASVEFGAG